MEIIKLSIEADSRLVDTLGDYLVGVFQAAVEFAVDETLSTTLVHGFLQMEAAGGQQLDELKRQVADYGAEVAAIFGLPAPRVSCEVLADQDWSTSWREHFHPFTIVPGLVIAPSWEPYRKTGEEQVIVMDPGMAFGTGHHATTRLCLELLRRAVARTPGCRVLDVGTGTGILGMAAALFGAGAVTALDNDREAIAIAADNVRGNNLQAQVNVSAAPLAAVVDCYQVVVANIVHDTLLDLADDLARVTIDGGELILSGLICGEQVQSILHHFHAASFRLIRELQDGEWCALHLVNEEG